MSYVFVIQTHKYLKYFDKVFTVKNFKSQNYINIRKKKKEMYYVIRI